MGFFDKLIGGGTRNTRDVVAASRMKPKAFLGNVAGWESAGLCTPDEAAAARAMAGLSG